MRSSRRLCVRAVRAYLCAPLVAPSAPPAQPHSGRVRAAERRAAALAHAARLRRRQHCTAAPSTTAPPSTRGGNGDNDKDAAAATAASLDAAASLGRTACLLTQAHKRPPQHHRSGDGGDNDEDDDEDASVEALLHRVDAAWQHSSGEAKLAWACATPSGRAVLRNLHALRADVADSGAESVAAATKATTTSPAHRATLVDYVAAARMRPMTPPPSSTNTPDAAVTRKVDAARERQRKQHGKQQLWSLLGPEAALAFAVDVKELQQCRAHNVSAQQQQQRASDGEGDAAHDDASAAQYGRELGIGHSARRAYVMQRLLPYLDDAAPSLAHVRARAQALCDEYDAQCRRGGSDVGADATAHERAALHDQLARFQARLPALQRLVESLSK